MFLGQTRSLRVGVTGLARTGKTAFLTSVAANLLAQGAGLAVLPALSARLAGRGFRAAIAPSGADATPRFDYRAHLASLAADPARWPERTASVSLLSLDLEIARTGLASALPPRQIRLEFLDYPGEWLLDLPLLGQEFQPWSEATLRRLQTPEAAPIARDFLAFAQGLPQRAPADETLAATGHALYRTALQRLRDEAGLAFLQPGRFLMPAPGPEPPWASFFPLQGRGGLASLLAERYDAYRRSVRDELVSPLFGRVDRLVVLADVLSALHTGPAAFEDARAALSGAAEALRWRPNWTDQVPLLRDLGLPDWSLPNWSMPGWVLPAWLRPGGIRRVAFAATKADHVADRQRGNLAALVRNLTELPRAAQGVPTGSFAIAAIRCTEDFVWTLEGRNISAVRGRALGDDRLTRSYPGEVPDRLPDPSFWAHPFLALPEFEPRRLPEGGRGGASHIGLDLLLAFLLEDVL